MGGFLTRDQIIQARGEHQEEVNVPEWGGTILVRELTAAQFDAVGTELVRADGTADTRKAQNLRAKLCAMTIIDQEGHQLFTTKDIEMLGAKGTGVIDRIANVVMRLSGLSEEAVEEETKNSETTRADALPSD